MDLEPQKSVDCGSVASKLWLEEGQEPGVLVAAWPSDELPNYLQQVAVGLFNRSIMTLLLLRP